MVCNHKSMSLACFVDPNCCNNFQKFKKTPEAQAIKTKIEKWEYVNLNTLMHCQGNTQQRGGQRIGRRHLQIDQAFKKINQSRIKNPLKKWSMETSRRFSRDEI